MFQDADLLRQREYDVEVRDRQQFGCPLGQPSVARHGRAFWAMPVSARILRDGAMPTRIALFPILQMAAERRCAAAADRFEGLAPMGAEQVAPLSEELFSVPAEDIGHFEPMLSHRSGGTVLAAGTRSSEPSVSSGLRVDRTALSARCG